MAERGPRVEVEGMARLRRELRALEGNLDDLKDAHAAAGAIVAAAAAARAPRRSGKLAASVRNSRAAAGAHVIAGSAAVPYAGPIHWGWPARHIEPNPFAADAAQATESQWLPAYEASIRDAVDRVGGAPA